MRQLNDSIDIMEEAYSSPTGKTVNRISLAIEIVNDEKTFSSLQQEWTILAETSAATIFQTHEWLFLWWKHFGAEKNRRLHIIVFRYDGNIVAIAPLFSQTAAFLGIRFLNRVSLIGSGSAFGISSGMFLDDGPSDYLDFIVHPGFEEEVSSAFTDHVKKNTETFGTMEFVNLKPASFIMRSLLPFLKTHGLTCKASQADSCPYLVVPSSIDEYFKRISPSVRRRLQQARKAAAEKTLYATTKVHALEDYHRALDELIYLHQQRWNNVGYPGLFSDQRFTLFQHDVVEAFHRKGWLWCTTAEANGRCVAGRLAFKFNNTYFDYLSGFDDNSPAAKRRPGLALLVEMLEEAVSEHNFSIDLLRGDEQYKFELTSELNYNWNVSIAFSEKKSTAVYRFAAAYQLLRYLAGREIRLVRVQSHQHRFPAFIVHYLKFRTPLFTRKFKKLMNKNTPPAEKTVETV